MQCFRVFVRTTLLRQMNMGSLTCAQKIVGVCRTHEGGGGGMEGSGTSKSAQELTQRDRNTVPYPDPPGDRTQGLRS